MWPLPTRPFSPVTQLLKGGKGPLNTPTNTHTHTSERTQTVFTQTQRPAQPDIHTSTPHWAHSRSCIWALHTWTIRAAYTDDTGSTDQHQEEKYSSSWSVLMSELHTNSDRSVSEVCMRRRKSVRSSSSGSLWTHPDLSLSLSAADSPTPHGTAQGSCCVQLLQRHVKRSLARVWPKAGKRFQWVCGSERRKKNTDYHLHQTCTPPPKKRESTCEPSSAAQLFFHYHLTLNWLMLSVWSKAGKSNCRVNTPHLISLDSTQHNLRSHVREEIWLLMMKQDPALSWRGRWKKERFGFLQVERENYIDSLVTNMILNGVFQLSAAVWRFVLLSNRGLFSALSFSRHVAQIISPPPPGGAVAALCANSFSQSTTLNPAAALRLWREGESFLLMSARSNVKERKSN